MTVAGDVPVVRLADHVLRPDPARVVGLILLPGQEPTGPGGSRSSAVIDRVLALSDRSVRDALAATTASFAGRHHDLEATWEAHFALVAHRLEDPDTVPAERRRLIGAYFTQEYALEGAALFNPSMVEHPDQRDVDDGSTRFLMSLRAVGEGHLSSIEWRTGTVDASGEVTLAPAATHALLPAERPATYSRASFQRQLDELAGDRTNSTFVLDALPETFGRAELGLALDSLHDQRLTRGAAVRTTEQLEWLAASSYAVEFATDSVLEERVLMPRGPSESRGMEDVRMVRFAHPDGAVEYLGTYTGWDGRVVDSHLLRTHDFRSFEMTRLSGPGARNKGLALFPRQVGGRFVALSRADRESNAVTTSTDLHHWEAPVLVQTPVEAWEVIQLGNCGSPIETHAGWLMLTHGVGAMRGYSMGAVLLDLDDPTIVVGRLRRPLLSPTADERCGYVPNVVYSCGALRHGGTLVIPYGCSDQSVRIARVDLDALLAALT